MTMDTALASSSRDFAHAGPGRGSFELRTIGFRPFSKVTVLRSWLKSIAAMLIKTSGLSTATEPSELKDSAILVSWLNVSTFLSASNDIGVEVVRMPRVSEYFMTKVVE